MKKTVVKIGDKVVKLREERQLLAQFLVIHQARPELLPNLPRSIGDYEIAVFPRSLFSCDGTLLVPKYKSSFMSAIKKAIPSSPINVTLDFAQDVQDADFDSDNNELNIVDDELFGGDVDLNVSGLSNIDFEENENRVIIFDGMAVVQSMKKNPTMKKIFNLPEQFIKRIRRLMNGYTEGRVLFD